MATEQPSAEEWVSRFRNAIPIGSSTNSTAPKWLPDEPAVIVRGKGCRVWDAEGREFIDFRNALGPVTLGHGFPPVDDAIRRQLQDGINFGHPHPLECEVAEMICDVIPCAEQARFLKTGGEAVAACIRLARYHTGRDHVIQIGYNGWVNTLASGARVLPTEVAEDVPPGVPPALSALHHSCKWNDLEGVKQVFAGFPGKIAALVVAASYAEMAAGEQFYPALRKLTQENGTLLIFDEIVTGFRLAVGGVQEYFDVVPDLAVFAKGVANGMPLSVYTGKREIMQRLYEATVSSTMGGETLSLAAAKAAITTYRNEDVIGHLWRQGEKMWAGLADLFRKHSIPAGFKGFWPCPQFTPAPDAPQDLAEQFFRAAYRNGVAMFGVPYVTFSHKDADVAEALERLDKACREL